MSIPEMMALEATAFGARAREARACRDVTDARAGRPRASVLELAAEMAALMEESVSDRDFGKWLRGEAVPGSLARLWALGRVLNADPGWLAFNGETEARAPAPLRPPLVDDVDDDEPLPRPASGGPAKRRA